MASVPQVAANVTALFEGTQQFALKSEKERAELHKQTSESAQKMATDLDAARVGIVSEATKLRDDIVMWSDNYAANIEGMVKSSDFKFDSRNSRRRRQSSTRRMSRCGRSIGGRRRCRAHRPNQVGLAQKARWLYTYFLGRLNTELHTKTISIEGKNVFEMYRQICNIIDAVS